MSRRNRQGARVCTGLERLAGQGSKLLGGKRIGLLAHAASVTADLQYAWDVLGSMPGVRLQALFSPEHGLMGTHQDQESVSGSGAPASFQGLPLYSLYGETAQSLRPRPEALAGLDALIVDLQDVGSRYYTFIYTLSHCMEACRDQDVEVWVLDRPNPLGGRKVEGRPLLPGFESFVGRYALPVRHGLTIGECAVAFREVFGVRCRLRIVPMRGWRRSMWFDQTGLPWISPSPNMPTLDTAAVYPGTCLVEGTNLSEGRGTTRPFEIVGAPWIDPLVLATELRSRNLPGVFFRPVWFKPAFHKYAGQLCGGVQIHVLDRGTFLPFRTGAHLLKAAAGLWPEWFRWRQEPYEFETARLAIDLLAGGSWLREAVEGLRDLDACLSEGEAGAQKFQEKIKALWIYSARRPAPMDLVTFA
jgi:uncharacterized protein YbbC (DUF1343 family)